ncbi:MAG: hypothetical protein AAFY28_06065 [Actinomycetota bacterium]
MRLQTVGWLATAFVLGVAVTLIVTQAWTAGAAPGDDDATFVPMAGCRLVDTRAGVDNVGPRSTPLGEGDVYEIDVHGSNGECIGPLAIPVDAVGVAFNVTAVGATERSNVRVYPGDLTEVPLLSNLNVAPGAPPAPNKVDVQLSPTGSVKVFNFKGSVDVIFDVVGFYTNSSLLELDQRLAVLEEAKTQTVVVTAAGFQAGLGGVTRIAGAGCGYNQTNNAGMFGNIPLPVGATVTGLRANITDMDSIFNGVVRLRYFPPVGASETIGTASTQGFPGDAEVDGDVTPTVIEPDGQLEVKFEHNPTGGSLSLCSVELTYVMP